VKLIDSHCHLDFENFNSNRQEVIERAAGAGVSKMINVGSSLRGTKASIEIASGYPHIWATVGLHPHDSETIMDLERTMDELRELAKNDKVVAVGECGLDHYFSSHPELDSGSSEIPDQVRNDTILKQKELFKIQLELAQELSLPIIIHSRDSESDTLGQLSVVSGQLSKKGVLHCFTYGQDVAKKFLDLGFYIGFTGFITFEQAKFDSIREAAKVVPLDRILIETDAPFLAPEPNRGKRNEPAFMVDVAQKVAELKNLSLEEVAEQTTKNAEKLFGI